jgi:2-polyprenyl-3-methyl-5-hydroxy-6-metoxy-1,4-benzoquinol methylase
MNDSDTRGTDWDGYSATVASRKQSPEWAVLRTAREQHYDRFFTVSDAETVLDAGCGHGEYTVFALQRGARVWAIDASPAMLKYSEEACRAAGVRAEGFSHQSVMEIRYPDEHFDVVYCLSVLECISDPELALRELTRVLKPGGRLYLDVCNSRAVHWHFLFRCLQLVGAAPKGDMRYFAPSELRSMVVATGCELVADCGQAFSPPFSGIYTADLRRYTIFPEWLIRPLDKAYLWLEKVTNHRWPFNKICWHYFLEARKPIAG